MTKVSYKLLNMIKMVIWNIYHEQTKYSYVKFQICEKYLGRKKFLANEFFRYKMSENPAANQAMYQN